MLASVAIAKTMRMPTTTMTITRLGPGDGLEPTTFSAVITSRIEAPRKPSPSRRLSATTALA